MPARESDSAPGREFTITRIFDATRDLVFKAWSDPKYVSQWWGPRDYTTTFCEIDFRVGGAFRYCMCSPEGKEYWNRGEYREIVAPERIVNTMYFCDAAGNFVEPSTYGMDGFPSQMCDTVAFDVHGEAKTRLTLRRNHSVQLAARFREDEGWNQSLDRFAEVLLTLKETKI
jgi:uncharacterized protein YndB with AHSA1/START domain